MFMVCLALQVSVLDKSKMDWQDFKKTDKEVQEELEAHARSDKQYLDRQVGANSEIASTFAHAVVLRD